MDSYRFYVPNLPAQAATGTPVRLPDDQSHHARTVLRLAGNEPVVLFDGNGAWAQGTIRGPIDKRHPVAVAISPLQHDPPAPLQLTIAAAVPKGERAEWLIEQCSQLNVAAIQWLDTDRSVVKPKEGGGKMEKWRRLAIESAKQCHRTHLMKVLDPLPLADALRLAPRALHLDPRAPDTLQSVRQAQGGDSGGRLDALFAFVGPEGGWSERETSLLHSAHHAHVVSVRLTPTVLRIETACAAIAALLMTPQ